MFEEGWKGLCYTYQMQNYPSFLRTLLENRGIKTIKEAEIFLNPDYERDVHDPFLLPDMDKAVERILLAIDQRQKIVIYSDYDADGIPGGVILHDFFEKIACPNAEGGRGHENFTNYIPHRHLEGFGLNHEAIDKFQEEKVKLIITVDCGIADVAEVVRAKKHGIDVIITDHHLPTQAGLPEAVAVVDAKRADNKYPFPDLCGAGVAFKLVQALVMKMKDRPSLGLRTIGVPIGFEKWLLDMVGIATLSDMVPLVGENRALAVYGLKVLRKSPRIGLLKLLRLLKIEQKNLTEDDIGFSISPRINAASRMGNPEDAFKLFIAQTDEEADICARHLDKINNERKGVVASMVKEIRKIMKARYAVSSLGGPQSKDALGKEALKKKVIVIGNPDWKPSLVGLAASSLSDDHKCSVFIWGRDGNDVLKGSCRSDGSVSLIDLMGAVEPGILKEFGGHVMAGGFSVIQEKVHLLEEKLQEAYEKLSTAGSLSRLNLDIEDKKKIDAKLTLDDITPANYKLLEKMAPFGTGNPKPLFLFEKIVVDSVRNFGKEENHLEIIFKNSQNRNVKAIGFFQKMDSYGAELKEGDKIDLLANFEKSTFRGYTELRLRIVNIENVI